MEILKKTAALFCMTLLLWGVVFISRPACEEDLTVSMAYLPHILEEADKSVFVAIIDAMDKFYPGRINRGIVPFSRSLHNVVSGKADFHMPMIKNKALPEASLPYAYSTEKIGEVCFVIYSNRDEPITVEAIRKAKFMKHFPLKIESMLGLAPYFDFPIKETSHIVVAPFAWGDVARCAGLLDPEYFSPGPPDPKADKKNDKSVFR